MTPELGPNKRIFISDIHMGDERSMDASTHGLHPYGWLNRNIPKLIKFLSDQLRAEDVGQVVILGDLFDQWVIPTDFDPIARLDGICSNPANRGIIDHLKALANGRKLSFVPGNHDMSLCQKDMPITKAFINQTFPGINFICGESQPSGVYRADDLVAEHGDMYCLFNAPDTWTHPGIFLPLGYFISRLVAYKVAQTGLPQNYLDILCKFILEFKSKPNFIYDLFLAVAGDAGLKKNDKIDMETISGFEPAITIDEVGNKYRNLIDDWNETHDKIDSTAAIEGDCLGLSWAANRVYLGPGTSPDIHIAIFGHTHIYKMIDFSLNPPSDQEHPSDAIYVNSGAWVDSEVCTYVETEMDEESRRHYVRIKSYPENILLNEGFVDL